MELPSPSMAAHAQSPSAIRTNVCAVCGAVSKNFYLNYGAPVCFSCRAFFRCEDQWCCLLCTLVCNYILLALVLKELCQREWWAPQVY